MAPTHAPCPGKRLGAITRRSLTYEDKRNHDQSIQTPLHQFSNHESYASAADSRSDRSNQHGLWR